MIILFSVTSSIFSWVICFLDSCFVVLCILWVFKLYHKYIQQWTLLFWIPIHCLGSEVAVMITPWWKSLYWILYCAAAIQFSHTFESCWLYPGRHWLCLLFVISVFQVSHWSIWSIWSQIFCRVIDMKLISLFYMWATNILSTVCWKCCLFSRMYFWHLCSIFFHDWNTTWVINIKK